MSKLKRTVIIGIGNTDFGDDYIGPAVSHLVADQADLSNVDIIDKFDPVVDLLDLLAVYDKAIIIDAIKTSDRKIGRIVRTSPEKLISQSIESPHNIDFVGAIELGKRLDLPLPGEIVIFGIEAGDTNIPLCYHSPEVEKAIPACADMVLKEIE